MGTIRRNEVEGCERAGKKSVNAVAKGTEPARDMTGSSCTRAALTLAGCHVPFGDAGSAAMKMLADTNGIIMARRIACHTWDTIGAVAAG
jgi:hypothetical protein